MAERVADQTSSGAASRRGATLPAASVEMHEEMSVPPAMMDDVAHGTTTLVGRDAELSTLIEVLGVAPVSAPAPGDAARRTHVVLAGDAGVGKTRLLAELCQRAGAAGWQAYVGHCVDFADSAVAYLPFSEVLGSLDDDLPDVVDRVVEGSPALGRLRPVRRRLDADAADPATSGSGDRSSLFNGLHRLLEAAAQKAPLLLVVEDAHWADQSTRDLLTYLFTRPFESPVAVVVSYRADDLHRRHPLRRLVAEWARLPAVERMVLGPLADDAVRAMVDELDPGIAGTYADRIVRRAEGNAFFVEELLGAAEGPDRWVPDELADLLLVRLDRLDERARDVVRTASVAGRRVAHDLLATVTELDDDTLEAAVRVAVESSILVAQQGHYSFRHALLAEAVYDDLLPGQRVRLHGAYAAALATLPGRGTAAELAHHARRAGEPALALSASVQAGDEAATVGGPDEAAQHYETALALAADPALAAGVDLAQLTLKAADALSLAGRPQRAADLLAEQLDRLGDVSAAVQAQLLADRAVQLLMLESGRQALDQSLRAMELLPGDAPPAIRARVLTDRATVLAAFREQLDEVETVALEALAVAERHDLSHLAAEAVTTLSAARRGGPQEPLRESLREAVRRAEESGSLAAQLRGLFLLGRSYEDWGELDQAAALFEQAVEQGRAAAIPWGPYAADARWQLIWIRVVRGDWDAALELGDTASAPAPLAAVLDAVVLGVHQARGRDVAAAARALREHWPDDGAVTIHSAALEMVEAGRRGDVAGVLAAYDDAVGFLGRIWKPWFSARIRLAAVAAGQVARLLPDLPAAERPALVTRVERLHADGHTVLANDNDPHWGPEGRAWAKRLDAETLRVRWLAGIDAAPQDVLVETWRECEQLFEEFGHVHELAQVRATLAAILRAAGDPAAAREVADLAREAAHRLGARPLLDELTALGSSPARTPPAGPATLTPREREILTLVAAGRSNGEIGKQLFISTKTVSVHVSNILGKLGAAGRTEAAAIARRQGLLG